MQLKKIKIGKHTLKSNILLAPMSGISDKPFRALCCQQGAGLATSEMVIMQEHLLATNKSKYRLDFRGERPPISVQIASSNAGEMSAYAKQALKLGANIVDINMGCPAKKVCNKLAGSALMQDETLVGDILTAVVGAVDIPVTLKIRTGWDEKHKNAINIAKIAHDAGVKMLTIHGRTRADKYKNVAEYDTIKSVAEQVNIPIIANGDITSPEKAQQVLQYTGAAGVMVGRATRGNPWIVGQIDYYLKTGKKPKKPTLKNKKQTILQHIKQIYKFYPDFLSVKLARKHIFWYAIHLDKNLGLAFWKKVNKTNNQNEQYQMLNNFLKKL